MHLSENNNIYLHHSSHTSPSPSHHTTKQKTPPPNVPISVVWPIALAILPTLGSFFGGTSEIWGDFVITLLMLYYVYKWMTVPWTYYESARSRRILHTDSLQGSAQEERNPESAIMNELRLHELIGLVWVMISPAIAGYTLYYSRYVLNHHQHYINSFNITVFVFGASVKPLMHLTTLLRERTIYLQKEIHDTGRELGTVEKRLNLIEKELKEIRHMNVSKKHMRQTTRDIGLDLQQLSNSMHKFESKEVAMHQWYERSFQSLNSKLREFDAFFHGRMETPHVSFYGVLISLTLLPFTMVLWTLHRMIGLLPIPHKLSNYSKSTSSTSMPSRQLHQWKPNDTVRASKGLGTLPLSTQRLSSPSFLLRSPSMVSSPRPKLTHSLTTVH